MAVRKINFIGDALFSAVHIAAEEVVIRSDSASDTGLTPTLYGVGTSSGVLEEQDGRWGTGKAEWISGFGATLKAFDTLQLIDLGSDSAGAITILSNDGTAAVGDIRFDSQPTAGETIVIGLSGSSITYEFVTGPVSGDNEVLIGASTAATADNLASAINDASTGTSTPVDGTAWQMAGTAPAAANNKVSATVASSVVTITDRIKCARQLAWDVTYSDAPTALTIRTPLGGADGTLLGSFSAGSQTFSTATGIELDTEDLATNTLPDAYTGNSSSLSINGRCTIEVRNASVDAGTIALKYQVSNDGGTNWQDGESSITSLTGGAADEKVTPTEHVGLLRLVITSNSNTGPLELNVKVIH